MDIVTHALSGAVLGAAYAPDEEQRLPLMAIGAIAGMAPDLDALCELKGKLAAWRYHRVLLHGLPTIVPQAIVLYLGVQFFSLPHIATSLLWAIIISALLMHLLLDSVTSFGTALGFPFSRRRFSTHSHFIVDPIVLLVLTLGLWLDFPKISLLILAGYLIGVILLRRWLVNKVRDVLAQTSDNVEEIGLEPGPFAPWDWLVIVPQAPTAYRLSHIACWGKLIAPWQYVEAKCDPHTQQQAINIPLIQAFLATATYPRWSEFTENGKTSLLVEDVKWWFYLPFRPLAFLITDCEGSGEKNVKQLPIFWTNQNF